MEYNEAINFMKIFDEQQQMLLDKDPSKPFNKYAISDSTRDKILNNHDVTEFETQLEDLLLDYIHNYVSEEVMNEYLPQIQGIKLVLMYNQGMYGQVNKDVIDYIDKYVDSNVYNQSLIDPQLQPVYKMLTVIKKVTTATALGFNLRSGVRELLQGT